MGTPLGPKYVRYSYMDPLFCKEPNPGVYMCLYVQRCQDHYAPVMVPSIGEPVVYSKIQKAIP